MAFLAQYRGIQPLEAARILAGEWKPPEVSPQVQLQRERKKRLLEVHRREHDRLCRILHSAWEVMRKREAQATNLESLLDDPEFLVAFEAYNAAQTMLDNLEEPW